MKLLLRAPAKLNLFLHVTGRRADGFHDLQTVFQLIDLCDEIEIGPGRGFEYRDDTGGALGEEHLCLRAWKMLCAHHRDCPGVSVRLRKRIPTGAGLGGGSSDAAAVLRGLNHLWGLGHSTAELADMGQALGADVPVFVTGRTAWGEGTGERLTPCTRPAGTALVLPPPRPLSSAQAYAELAPGQMREAISADELEAHWGSNVFEDWARRQDPEIGIRLDTLRQDAPAALSGSGGSVFAWCATPREAGELLAKCPSSWGGILAEGLDCSPVLQETS